MTRLYGSGSYGSGSYGLEPRLAVSTITLDGVAVPLATVFADVTIRHGRADYYDQASPATATLQLLRVSRAFTRPFRLGALLVVMAGDGVTPSVPLFTGRLTDATLEFDTLTTTAVGGLRTLSGYTIGAAAYPSEAWSARVTRAFTDAGLASILALQSAPTFDPVLVARAAGPPVALSDYLDELTTSVESAVADLPDGRILVQAIPARTVAGRYSLDPAEVAYAPSWVQRLPAANIVTVLYGDPTLNPRLSVTVQDASSIAIYGPIAVTVETTIAALADATAIANNRLTRNAYSHWSVAAAPLLYGRSLTIGQALELNTLPAAAPYDPWEPILEGWTDRIVSDRGELTWTMELELSDPLLSGLALPWNTIPVAKKWNTINPATAWRDAVSLDTL